MRRAMWLLPAAIIILILALIAMNPGNEPKPLPGNEVDSSGGVIEAFDGAVTLGFPAGALSKKTTISVATASGYPDTSRIIPGTAYDFGPNRTRFEKPVQLSIRYDSSKIPAGTDERSLRIVLATPSLHYTEWATIANSTVDTVAKMVTAPINSFSIYGITADDDGISPEYMDFMENPIFDLSGSVVINPSPSVVCKPGGELVVEAIYYDAEGHQVVFEEAYDEDAGGWVVIQHSPTYIWYLECETGSIETTYIDSVPTLTAGPYELMPSCGTILLKAPLGAEGKKGKLVVRVEHGWAIRAQAEVPVEFMSGARLEPRPADCPAGSMVQLYCHSPYSYIGALKETVRFEWTTTGAFGALLGEGGQTQVSSTANTVIYKANGDAPDGASDSVVVRIYEMGELKAEAETTVLISGVGFSLEPDREPWAVPGTRKLINCRFSGERPSGQLEYNWTCGSAYGSLWYPDPKEDSVWYMARDDAADYGTEEVTVEVYAIQGSVKSLLGRASTTLEIYNPQTIYNLCSDERGEHFLKGSGSQWHYEIVGHGWVTGGFKARPGDRLRMVCINKGVNTGDIYLRVGMVGTGSTSKTQLLLTDGQVYDGLDMTFEIKIS